MSMVDSLISEALDYLLFIDTKDDFYEAINALFWAAHNTLQILPAVI